MAASPSAEPLTPAVGAMTPHPHRVVSRRRETHDTWTVALEPLSGHELPLFASGQFGMLYAFGVGEIPDLAQRRGHASRPPALHDTRGGRGERRSSAQPSRAMWSDCGGRSAAPGR